MTAFPPSAHVHAETARGVAEETATPPSSGPTPEQTGLAWRRADGQVRVLIHLFETSAGEPDQRWSERVTDWLDTHVPGWDDHLALVGAGLFALLLGALAALL